jgi:hypothetical protein
MFWWLLASGRVNLYLSTNTSWVVPVGAVLLTAAAIGRLASARGSEPEPIGRREEIIMALAGRHAVVVVLRRHHVDERDHPVERGRRTDVESGRAGPRETSGSRRRLRRGRLPGAQHAGG